MNQTPTNKSNPSIKNYLPYSEKVAYPLFPVFRFFKGQHLCSWPGSLNSVTSAHGKSKINCEESVKKD